MSGLGSITFLKTGGKVSSGAGKAAGSADKKAQKLVGGPGAEATDGGCRTDVAVMAGPGIGRAIGGLEPRTVLIMAPESAGGVKCPGGGDGLIKIGAGLHSYGEKSLSEIARRSHTVRVGLEAREGGK